MQQPPFDNEKDTLHEEILSKRLRKSEKQPKPSYFVKSIAKMTISYCNNPPLTISLCNNPLLIMKKTLYMKKYYPNV